MCVHIFIGRSYPLRFRFLSAFGQMPASLEMHLGTTCPYRAHQSAKRLQSPKKNDDHQLNEDGMDIDNGSREQRVIRLDPRRRPIRGANPWLIREAQQLQRIDFRDSSVAPTRTRFKGCSIRPRRLVSSSATHESRAKILPVDEVNPS